MTDFSDIEKELRALRPLRPSDKLYQGVAGQLKDLAGGSDPATAKIIVPERFNFGWISLGLGLAAAAALLLLARVNPPGPVSHPAMAAISPSSAAAARLVSSQFIPAGASRVVYRTQDEGLIFPRGSSEPVRQVRSRVRETLQWQNPATGASLQVSYPSDEVRLIPLGAQ